MQSILLFMGALLLAISESVLGQEPNEFKDKIKELRQQIEQGHKEAKKELADRYFDGGGVERDFEEAADCTVVQHRPSAFLRLALKGTRCLCLNLCEVY